VRVDPAAAYCMYVHGGFCWPDLRSILHVLIERILLEVTSGVRVDRAASMWTHFDMVTRVEQEEGS